MSQNHGMGSPPTGITDPNQFPGVTNQPSGVDYINSVGGVTAQILQAVLNPTPQNQDMVPATPTTTDKAWHPPQKSTTPPSKEQDDWKKDPLVWCLGVLMMIAVFGGGYLLFNSNGDGDGE